MAIVKRPYEILVRVNADGSVGAHYKEAYYDEEAGRDVSVEQPQAIEGAKSDPEVLKAVKELFDLELVAKTEASLVEAKLQVEKAEKAVEDEVEKAESAQEEKAALVAELESLRVKEAKELKEIEALKASQASDREKIEALKLELGEIDALLSEEEEEQGV